MATAVAWQRFPDHSDEGWPAVRVRLPLDANFVYAASGPLTRVARWKVGRAESEVLDELSSNTNFTPFALQAGGGVVDPLGFDATLRVKGAAAGLTLRSFEQFR